MGSLSLWADVFSIVGFPGTILAWWQIWRMTRRGVQKGVDIRKWIVVVLLSVSTGIWLVYVAVYFGLVENFRYKTTESYVSDPSLWESPDYTPKIVRRQNFLNEVVPLDGHEYIGCTFENVTFLYEGRTPIRMTDSDIKGKPLFNSHNQGLRSMIELFRKYGLFSPCVQFKELQR